MGVKMGKRMLLILFAIVFLITLDVLFILSSCAMNAEQEYVCKLIDDGSWVRNGWVMATSESDAISACEEKYGDYNTYCADCWLD